MAATDSHRQNAIQAVQQALDEQVQAWNNGDLEKAMTYYWNSPEMLWINTTGVEKGCQEVLDMFRKNFADASQMGIYTYTPLYIEQLSEEAVYYVFRWQIAREGKRLTGGISSQIWKNLNGQWVVTSEHAS